MYKIPSKGLALVDFWAPWCGPCKSMLPVLEKLVQEIKQEFQVIKINVDETDNDYYTSLIMEHNIKSIPHLVLYKDGAPIKTLIGAQTYSTLLKLVQDNIS